MTRHGKDLATAETGDLDSVSGWTGKYIQFLKRSLRRPWLNVAAVSANSVCHHFRIRQVWQRRRAVSRNRARVRQHRNTCSRRPLDNGERISWCGRLRLSSSAWTKSRVFTRKTGGSGQGAAEDQIGSITLNFIDWDERRPANEILADVRKSLSGLAGISIQTTKAQDGPQQGKPIQIELSSRFPDILTAATGRIREALEPSRVYTMWMTPDRCQASNGR